MKTNNIQIYESEATLNKKTSTEENQKDDKKKCMKPIYIIFIVIGIIIIVGEAIALFFILKKKDDDENENESEEEENDNSFIFYEKNENNSIKTTMSDDFDIPSDKKIQIVGANFPHKNTTFIIGAKNNKTFIIDDDGLIKNVKKEDLPLTFYFNESITNGSYLFKDVKCFKTIDLSKMDSSKMVDASNMFENSNFEEIYFGTEKKSDNENRNLDETDDPEDEEAEVEEEEVEEEEEKDKRKEYFDTKNIKSASNIFMNCKNLKKIQFPPSFNVGKKIKTDV